MSTSFKGNDKGALKPSDRSALEKARGPFGGQIVPEKFNGTAPAPSVGGWEDAKARSAATMSNTARRGAGKDAARSTAAPTTKPPTPAATGATGNKAHPWAPAGMAKAKAAKGSAQGPGAESLAGRMSTVARKGNVKLPMSPTRHQQPALPEPLASFPKAAPPRGGRPVPAPAPRGRMAGTLQGGTGKKPGQSTIQ